MRFYSATEHTQEAAILLMKYDTSAGEQKAL